jgi:uncharacterized protein (DUF2235 family)
MTSPRQLIVCCDGTSNHLTGWENDTNVTKLCGLLDPDGRGQRLFYDPGVGNPGQLPSTTWIDALRRRGQRLSGLALGQGIFENIGEGYSFLMQNFQAGDQIWIFGFSRGAFTARSIAGLVMQFGLLRPESQALLPTLLHTYFSDRRESKRYKAVSAQVGQLFAGQSRRVPVWFVGVWDTVASVGLPLLGQQTITARPSIVGKRVHHVRQALALDEHRSAFEPRPYIIEPGHDYAADGQSLRQLWFAGSHCDVGGGYGLAQSGAANEALLWMLQEACGCGLRLQAGLHGSDGALDEAGLRQHLQAPQGAAAVACKEPASEAPDRGLHSETYDTAWWALAGLKQRDPTRNPDWNRADTPVQAQEHPSVARPARCFAQDTVWRRRRPAAPLVGSSLGVIFFALLAGRLLATPAELDLSAWGAFLASGSEQVRAAWAANLALSAWQLGWLPWAHPLQWPWPAPMQVAPPALRHLGGALLADLGLIGCYAYLLARSSSWAFARVAGLRRAAALPRSTGLLNLLGQAAGVAVLADLVENLSTWAVQLSAGGADLPAAEWLWGLLMTAASAAKWGALLGCGLLLTWGLLARPDRRVS